MEKKKKKKKPRGSRCKAAAGRRQGERDGGDLDPLLEDEWWRGGEGGVGVRVVSEDDGW